MWAKKLQINPLRHYLTIFQKFTEKVTVLSGDIFHDFSFKFTTWTTKCSIPHNFNVTVLLSNGGWILRLGGHFLKSAAFGKCSSTLILNIWSQKIEKRWKLHLPFGSFLGWLSKNRHVTSWRIDMKLLGSISIHGELLWLLHDHMKTETRPHGIHIETYLAKFSTNFPRN